MGTCKCRQRKTSLRKLCHDRKCGQVELDILCADHLGRDANVSNTWLGAQSKGCWGPARQKPFVGRESFNRPMLAPFLNGKAVRAEGLGEMIPYPWHHERMGVGDVHQGKGARISSLLGVRRKQARFGLDLFEILNDGHGLEH